MCGVSGQTQTRIGRSAVSGMIYIRLSSRLIQQTHLSACYHHSRDINQYEGVLKRTIRHSFSIVNQCNRQPSPFSFVVQLYARIHRIMSRHTVYDGRTVFDGDGGGWIQVSTAADNTHFFCRQARSIIRTCTAHNEVIYARIILIFWRHNE